MATPEERRESAVQGIYAFAPANVEDWQDPVGLAYDALLRYFDDTDQEWIAEAIRLGGEEVRDMSFGHWHGTGTYRINEPEEDPSPDESDLADLRYDEDRAAAKDEG